MKIITYALFAVALAVTPSVAEAADVPDALSVEWEGKHPCEKLFEDAQVRIARCTFPPAAVHVCHAHPAYLSYVVSGGQGWHPLLVPVLPALSFDRLLPACWQGRNSVATVPCSPYPAG